MAPSEVDPCSATRAVRRGAILTVLVATALVGTPALAHDRSLSSSVVTPSGEGASFELRLRRIDVTALEAAGVTGSLALLDDRVSPALRAYVVARLRVETAAGTPCDTIASPVIARAAAPDQVGLAWAVRCEDRPVRVRSGVLRERPGHVHLARIAGEPPGQAHVLASESDVVALVSGVGESSETSLFDFVGLGFTHVLRGIDHLAFLILLVAIATRLRDLVSVVTGFTLGHAVSLTLAAVEAVSPRRAPVEILVALSIVFVAAENVWWIGERKDRWLPIAVGMPLLLLGLLVSDPATARVLVGVALGAASWLWLGSLGEAGARAPAARGLVAAVFGLAHGLAFAEVLAELTGGGRSIAWPLVGFNLGVELSQLAIVVPVFVLLTRARLGAWPRLAASAAGLALGVALLAVRL